MPVGRAATSLRGGAPRASGLQERAAPSGPARLPGRISTKETGNAEAAPEPLAGANRCALSSLLHVVRNSLQSREVMLFEVLQGAAVQRDGKARERILLVQLPGGGRQRRVEFAQVTVKSP